VADGGEKLWSYAGLARLWSWSLIAVAALLLALSVALQAGAAEGLSARWFAAAFGVSGLTGALLVPLFRIWLRRAAMPSVRLPQAVRATGPRRLEASRRDWRRWALATGVVLLVGGAAMLVFLVGVLGRGGTAEGVVVGMLAAWGVATLEDVRRIRAAERAEGRRYYAACRRPTGVGNRLVWLPRPDSGDVPGTV
jgi:ABC-type uncharacterized transport system permease subunit